MPWKTRLKLCKPPEMNIADAAGQGRVRRGPEGELQKEVGIGHLASASSQRQGSVHRRGLASQAKIPSYCQECEHSMQSIQWSLPELAHSPVVEVPMSYRDPFGSPISMRPIPVVAVRHGLAEAKFMFHNSSSAHLSDSYFSLQQHLHIIFTR